MKKKVKLTEKQLKNAVNFVLNEFFNRDDVDTMTSLGIKDPTEENVVNTEDLKQKCSEFIQKTNEYLQFFKTFYEYIDGVEENEDGINGSLGVRGTIKSRNLFGARDVIDSNLEIDLDNLDDSLRKVNWSLEEAIDAANMFI